MHFILSTKNCCVLAANVSRHFDHRKEDTMRNFAAILFTFLLIPHVFAQRQAEPIIDMHLHAFASNGMGPVDSVSWMYLPLKTPPRDDELMTESINMLRRYNIV